MLDLLTRILHAEQDIALIPGYRYCVTECRALVEEAEQGRLVLSEETKGKPR